MQEHRNSMGWYSYRRYPKSQTVEDRRAKADRAIKKLSAKQTLDPVWIEGPLAVTWWAKSWNRNLEGYADFYNRLARGRSYAKHGSVIDLRIDSGIITSLVQGSASKPYEIEISINPMKAPARKELIAACAGKLDSAEALLSGHFPEDLGRLLTEAKTGLFPHPKDIRFSCSCPDSASLCKHIAATLYGVGSRLDRDPAIFFLLRDVKLQDLISHAVKSEAKKMLNAKGSGESSRLKLGATDLGALFGVDLEKAITKPLLKTRTKQSAKKSTKKSAKKAGKKKVSNPIIKTKSSAHSLVAERIKKPKILRKK
jgi:uncharacterized Zn finger protein